MSGPTPSQPGWYDDGSGRERWFDGNAWTDHVRGEQGAGEVGPETAPIVGDSTVVVPAAQPPGPPPATAQLEQLQVGGGKGLRVAIAVLGALVLVAVVVVGVLLLVGRDDDDKDKGSDDATSPPVTETTPDAPSSSSLDVPTIDPSDFPSDLPTSEAPPLPDLPSDLPTEFPSDFLSDFPTDPEDFESWATAFLEP